MSTSDGRPLTRRELRELRKSGVTSATAANEIETTSTDTVDDVPTADVVVEEAAAAPEPQDVVVEAEAQVSESPESVDPTADVSSSSHDDEVVGTGAVEAVAEPELADEPQLVNKPATEAEPVTIAVPKQEAAAERPLTRRQRRRLGDTGVVPVAAEAQAPTDERKPAGDERPVRESSVIRHDKPVRHEPVAVAPRAAETLRASASSKSEADVTIGDEREEDPIYASLPETQLIDTAGAEQHAGTNDRSAALSRAKYDPRGDERAAPKAADSSTPSQTRDVAGERIAKSSSDRAPKQSFDELLTKPGDTSGRVSAGSSIVLDELPGAAALNAPVTATGELLITRSHELPAGFGSRGAAHGTTDGKEADAALLDGELPLASSPTPIAASSAISTSKAPSEVLRPPAPERNQKLILGLGIAAACLGIVVVVSLAVAYAMGAFN